jgi:16S rRNA (uracil1498-N3)-methyltransferase
MEYYYTPQENISGSKLEITGDEAKHLSKVLRKSAGEEIYVTDGKYNLYKTKIISADTKKIDCAIIEKIENTTEPQKKVFLYQSLLKNPSRFEFAIEKCTELGVYEIIPLISEHVINKTSSKTERWQSIALSAMKQSQRTYLPAVIYPLNFEEAVKENPGNSLSLIAHEQEIHDSVYIRDLGSTDEYDSIRVFIGPEGGFSKSEIDLAISLGFKVLNMGNRKYRSETAAILACGLILI